MTTNVMKTCKYLCVISILLVSTIACEKDIENIGVDIVDNNNFSSNTYTSEVIAYNENILKRKAAGLSQYLLGVYKDDDFGKIEASIVSQLGLPGGVALDFGDNNPTIDSVLIDIPYQATKNSENNTNGSAKFDLDSIIGDQSVAFNLEVFELGSFLSPLDPTDPTQTSEFYTNDTYLENTSLYSGTFTSNKEDTVTYISRKYDLVTPSQIYTVDTIKTANIAPSIKIPLDKATITEKFITNATESELTTNEAFRQYFRGLVIKATSNGNDNSFLVSLNLSAAKMTIYYSVEKTVDEAEDEDLNFNNINGETNVTIKDPKSFNFPFATIVTNTINRDYTGADIEPFITTPNTLQGEEKLFVQGASGSSAIIELFKNEDVAQLRANNWLINEANLYLYKDPSAVNAIKPSKLYIYDYNENDQILDIMTEGDYTVGGLLAYDDEGNSLDYYKFKITDLISEFLKADNLETTNPKLGIKVFNTTDIPINPIDTIIKDYNWNPKGVVLKGNLPTADTERIKLEIFYSELNN